MELLVEDMWRRTWFEWDQTGWSDGAKHKRGVFGSYSLFFYADKLEHIQKKKKKKKTQIENKFWKQMLRDAKTSTEF